MNTTQLIIAFACGAITILLPLAVWLIVRRIRQRPRYRMLRLYDADRRRLLLTLDPDALLYVEAEGARVRVYYEEGEAICDFALPRTMKSLEKEFLRRGILRCHRRYYVNPHRVTSLKRDRMGAYTAQVDVRGCRPIPVTPTYYKQISEAIR